LITTDCGCITLLLNNIHTHNFIKLQNPLIFNKLLEILSSNINLLYLHMVLGTAHTYYKTWLNKWVLALTFTISFFALSGYVASSLPNSNSAPGTTVLANKSVLKGGISYKRVVLALYKLVPSWCLANKYSDQNKHIYRNLLTSKYLHLKHLFLSIKTDIICSLKQQSYSSHRDYPSPFLPALADSAFLF